MQRPGPVEAFDRLRADRAPPDRAPGIVGPGVYAVFVRDGDRLPGLAVPETGLLYIGRSDRVERRNHFTMDNSGYSTLRRSLGALLREPYWPHPAADRGTRDAFGDSVMIRIRLGARCRRTQRSRLRGESGLRWPPVRPRSIGVRAGNLHPAAGQADDCRKRLPGAAA